MQAVKLTKRLVAKMRYIARKRAGERSDLGTELDAQAKKHGFNNWPDMMYHFRRQRDPAD